MGLVVNFGALSDDVLPDGGEDDSEYDEDDDEVGDQVGDVHFVVGE